MMDHGFSRLMMTRRTALALGATGLLAPSFGRAAEPVTLKIGVLKFGTAAWEIDVARRNGFDAARGLKIETLDYAGKDATSVALRAGAVDLILQDWPYVAEQRARGEDVVILPHRGPVGGLVMSGGARFTTLADLRGQKIGIAGGPLDKSWIVLKAYAKQAEGLDLASVIEPIFGAPPLINELLKTGDITVALQYWNFIARLDAARFSTVLPVTEVLTRLGVRGATPLNGWMARGEWASSHAAIFKAFGQAMAEAQNRLLTDDGEWSQLKSLMQADNDTVGATLKDAYRAGIVADGGAIDIAAVDRLLALIGTSGPGQPTSNDLAPASTRGLFVAGL